MVLYFYPSIIFAKIFLVKIQTKKQINKLKRQWGFWFRSFVNILSLTAYKHFIYFDWTKTPEGYSKQLI